MYSTVKKQWELNLQKLYFVGINFLRDFTWNFKPLCHVGFVSLCQDMTFLVTVSVNGHTDPRFFSVLERHRGLLRLVGLEVLLWLLIDNSFYTTGHFASCRSYVTDVKGCSSAEPFFVNYMGSL